MSQPLVGCPHCNRPITHSAKLAGKVIGCPHCNGRLTMPKEAPPAPPPPKPATQGPAPAAVRQDDLRFEPSPELAPGGTLPPREPWYYSFLMNYSAAIMWIAIAGEIIGLLALIIEVFVPLIGRAMESESTAEAVWICVGLIGLLIASLLVLVVLVVSSALIRLAVDSARHLRIIRQRLEEQATQKKSASA